MAVFWKMCGVDVHIDSNIGKRINLLTHALTTIAGESDVADLSSVAEANEDTADTTNVKMYDRHGIDNEDGLDVVDAPPTPRLQDDSLETQLWTQTRHVNQLR